MPRFQNFAIAMGQAGHKSMAAELVKKRENGENGVRIILIIFS
jgi:hypothetical protein